MKVSKLSIQNFRGISRADLVFPNHVVLIGDNNTGKSTVLEALDLVLGPDRADRRPPVDEHDFFRGKYAPPSVSPNNEGEPDQQAQTDDVATEAPKIRIDATVSDMTDEQQARFMADIEWWDEKLHRVLEQPDPADVQASSPCIRVSFVGEYDPEEDDFVGKTFLTRTDEVGARKRFDKRDKQVCGFLYLRTMRTGSRALSLEHGSLLDIILRLQEARPGMWEASLGVLSELQLSDGKDGNLGSVLESVNASLAKYVPKEWGTQPQLRVSNLTREHLRRVVTAFMATGDGEHLAPFYRQGTGTINMLVLALLSQIAQGKQNVIFAMEEPEIAIPPYAQKQIVNEVRKLSSQTIFTSHSPYVIEEFSVDETVPLARGNEGILTQQKIELPKGIKAKFYRQNFRTVFCEGLLARRVLVAEGATEALAFPAVARRLAELQPEKFQPLENLGVCTINADSEKKIVPMAVLYKKLGKAALGVCDKQSITDEVSLKAALDLLLMHDQKGFERLLVDGTTDAALERFFDSISWPQALEGKFPDPKADLRNAAFEYFRKHKGEGAAADFLVQCDINEIPEWIREAVAAIQEFCSPKQADGEEEPDAAKLL